MHVIETRDVRVDYEELTAVERLDLRVEEGSIFGLIGPNGAGKTSTIRVLATLLRPTHGEVRLGGIDAAEEPAAAHRILGYMPDLAPVDPDLRCREFLDLFAAAHFIRRRERRLRVEECLDLVSLSGKRDAAAGTLSRGMTQRLVLAKTLLHDPRVLLLDEPASGLDPIARVELRDILRSLRERGKSVLVSSHILTELAGFCDAIGIMERGRLVLDGRIDDLIARFGARRRVALELAAAVPGLAERLESLEGVHAVKADAVGVRATLELDGGDLEAAALLARLVAEGLPLCGFREERMGVEDIMMRVGAREAS